MTDDDRWEAFRSFAELGAAQAPCAQLELERVPARIEARAPESGVEAQYLVLVGATLAHRARWVVAQLPPSEEELNFLATGKLPSQA